MSKFAQKSKNINMAPKNHLFQEDDNKLYIEILVPGSDESNIEITWIADKIHILRSVSTTDLLLRDEYPTVSEIEVPLNIFDIDNIVYHIKNGILLLTIPKRKSPLKSLMKILPT